MVSDLGGDLSWESLMFHKLEVQEKVEQSGWNSEESWVFQSNEASHSPKLERYATGNEEAFL